MGPTDPNFNQRDRTFEEASTRFATGSEKHFSAMILTFDVSLVDLGYRV